MSMKGAFGVHGMEYRKGMETYGMETNNRWNTAAAVYHRLLVDAPLDQQYLVPSKAAIWWNQLLEKGKTQIILVRSWQVIVPWQAQWSRFHEVTQKCNARLISKDLNRMDILLSAVSPLPIHFRCWRRTWGTSVYLGVEGVLVVRYVSDESCEIVVNHVLLGYASYFFWKFLRAFGGLFDLYNRLGSLFGRLLNVLSFSDKSGTNFTVAMGWGFVWLLERAAVDYVHTWTSTSCTLGDVHEILLAYKMK